MFLEQKSMFVKEVAKKVIFNGSAIYKLIYKILRVNMTLRI